MDLVPDILGLLSYLVGLECWYAFTNPDTSEVTIAFGGKMPRARVNPRFPPDDPRQFMGEYDVWLQCPWRLEHANSVVVVHSEFGNYPSWGVRKGLNAVFGLKVVRVSVVPPAWDLVIELEQGYVLRAFPASSATGNWPSEDWLEGMAWTFTWRDQCGVTVGPGGRVAPMFESRWVLPPAPPVNPNVVDQSPPDFRRHRDSPVSILAMVGLLKGLTCNYIATVGGVGEVTLGIDVGASRHQPISPDQNPNHFKGGFKVRIQCAWRLEQGSSVLAVSNDYRSDNNWGAQTGLQMICNQRIIDFRVSPPAWDLSIGFEDGQVLRAFCDSSADNGPAMSWSVDGPEGFLVAVGPKGELATDEMQARWDS